MRWRLMVDSSLVTKFQMAQRRVETLESMAAMKLVSVMESKDGQTTLIFASAKTLNRPETHDWL